MYTANGHGMQPTQIMKLAMPVSLTQTLMKQLAIRLSCQKTAAKSLVISRRARGQTNRYASFKLNAYLQKFRLAEQPDHIQLAPYNTVFI